MALQMYREKGKRKTKSMRKRFWGPYRHKFNPKIQFQEMGKTAHGSLKPASAFMAKIYMLC